MPPARGTAVAAEDAAPVTGDDPLLRVGAANVERYAAGGVERCVLTIPEFDREGIARGLRTLTNLVAGLADPFD